MNDQPRAVPDEVLMGVIGCTVLFDIALWAAATICLLATGHSTPGLSKLVAFGVFARPGDPADFWQQPVGPAAVYWLAVFLILAAIGGGALGIWRLVRNRVSGDGHDVRSTAGTARRREVAAAAGKNALLRRGATLRPSLATPAPADIGHQLGRSRGVTCWASVEDSMVILGPPRSGKGLHLVIPLILGAPGAVVTTSTRPDNLTATMRVRESFGPVAVFDPQGLVPGLPSTTKWSPTRACRSPQTAMIRARALTHGAADGTTESSFWQSSAEQAVRCLLHAAALQGATAADLYRWSLSPVLASQAITTLTDHPEAAEGWGTALNSILSADPKQRDSIWAMVGIAFAALADPQVLDAVSPEKDDGFDPAYFLRERGTLYLLGTAAGTGTTSRLVDAFLEDILEAARKLAAGSPGARLDPPLTVVLDEAANYQLPSLPSLMSEGGGTGISTIVVLQSLAQARAVWGDHQGTALWDAAIFKIILGGGSTARDLDDLSRLIGTRTDRQRSESVGPDGRKSHSTSDRDMPILEPGQLRRLPFGTAVLMLRSARPIMLDLTRWTDLPNAKSFRADKQKVEALIGRTYHDG